MSRRRFILKEGGQLAVAICLIALLVPTASAQEQPGASRGYTPLPITGTPTVNKPPGPLVTQVPAGSSENAQSVSPDYKIAPNDLLEIEVFNVPELKRTVRVNTLGDISMPLVGTLRVGGLKPTDAEALLVGRYGSKYLQDPQISIFIKEFTTQRITLDGALVKPGIYPLTGQITLLRALALAGGGGQMADLENVLLFRTGADGKAISEKYDVMKIRTGEMQDPILQGDDVVVVNRDGTRAAMRDSLFRDVLDAFNPFASGVGNVSNAAR